MLVLHRTGRQESIELAGNTASFEQTVLKLIKLVISLPEEARDLWDRCQYRRFMGIRPNDVLSCPQVPLPAVSETVEPVENGALRFGNTFWKNRGA